MAGEPQGRPPPRMGGGRFQVVDTLGDGGTATVYLAWDGDGGRWCAIKALHHKFLRDDDMRRRFAQEAVALDLLKHPNVPALLAQGQDAIPPYMVMELARCGSTMDWVRDNGPMPPSMAADVIFQVCEALAEAHAMGIVHRDVKPHNFLLDDEGRTKLTDFGIARVSDHTSMTMTGSQMGTFSFMAPEQRSDTKSVDHRADIYSVGASLYTLLTAKTSAELFVADKDDELIADVNPVFHEVVLRATRYKPEERYASVLELQTDLMNALSRIPPAQESYPPLVRPRDPLPDGPPKVLPPGRRFLDLERSLALDLNQPTFIPGPDERARLEPEASDEGQSPLAPPRKVIPYFMPARTASPPPGEPRSGIPAYVDDSEVGGLQRQEDARERARLEEEVKEQVLRAQADAVPPPPEDDTRQRALVALTGAVLVAMLIFLLVLGVGSSWVNGARRASVIAADGLTAALEVDAAVVYELRGDRRTFEDIYQRYLDGDGAERLEAALAFVRALDGVVAAGGVEPVAEPKVRRLQAARDEYLRARDAWEATAATFPGSLSVSVGLARAP